MRRLHLIELHEQPWYPAGLRKMFQLALGRAGGLMRPFTALVPRLQELIEQTRPGAILDLCSGSGEIAVDVWRELVEELPADKKPGLLLSDLYPNSDAFEQHGHEHSGVGYFPRPVNALSPPADVPSCWMMVESLHHFRPEEARKILSEAARRNDAFIALESTRRHWTNVLAVPFVVPIPSIIISAFMLRPFRWSYLLWGLLVPVVPATIVFDSIVSNLRTYSEAELLELASTADAPGFRWEAGRFKMGVGNLEAIYLIGRRETSTDAETYLPRTGRDAQPGGGLENDAAGLGLDSASA